MHRLGQEKEVQLKLQKELDEAFPDKNVSFTDNSLRSMPYLNAVIQEGFR